MSREADKSQLNDTIVVAVLCRPEELDQARWRLFLYEYNVVEILPWFTGAVGLACTLLVIYLYTLGANLFKQSLAYLFVSPANILSFALVMTCPFIASLLLKKICKDKVLSSTTPVRLNVLPAFCTIGSSGFQYQTSGFTGLFPWAELTYCLEYPDSFIVTITRLRVLIPKRCFQSNAEINAVRQYVIKNKITYKRWGKGDAANITFSSDLNQIKITDQNPLEVDANFEEQHPESSLLSEPLMKKLPGQVLAFECAYDLAELRRINKKLFFARGLPVVGIATLVFSLIFTALPAAFAYFFQNQASLAIVQFFTANFWWIYPTLTLRLGYSFYSRQDRVLQNLVNLDQPFLMELGETSIRIKGRRSILTYNWSDFASCEETADYYICHLKHGNILLPKRAFSDRIKLAYVDNLLHQKIAKHFKG